MKDVFWFKHDSNARNDIKIQALRHDYGVAGYGMFFMIIEIMRESDNNRLPYNKKFSMVGIARDLGVEVGLLSAFIESCINDYELFVCDCEYFWSESLNQRLHEHEIAKEKRRIDGAKGGRPKKQTEQIEVPIEDKPTPKEVTFSAEVESITDSLCRKLRENNEKAKLPADLKKWNSAIDALHRIDGYEFDVIEKVCNWSQDNSFWKQNILSAPKLREKFAQLLLAMQEDERKKTNAESKGSFSNGTRTDSEDKRPTIEIPINPRIHELDIEAQLAKLRERAKAVGAPV